MRWSCNSGRHARNVTWVLKHKKLTLSHSMWHAARCEDELQKTEPEKRKPRKDENAMQQTQAIDNNKPTKTYLEIAYLFQNAKSIPIQQCLDVFDLKEISKPSAADSLPPTWVTATVSIPSLKKHIGKTSQSKLHSDRTKSKLQNLSCNTKWNTGVQSLVNYMPNIFPRLKHEHNGGF